MSYYVFRIDYGACYDLIKKELQEHKILRQGWGFDNMDLRNGDSTLEQMVKVWGDEGRARYSILSPMLNMEPGDIVIVPKLDNDAPLEDWKGSYKWARTFTILKCTKGYSFSPISTSGYGNDIRNDFGHIIGVEPIASFSYDYDDASRTVSKKFKAYRKAINNAYNEDFIKAVESLIAESQNGLNTHDEKTQLEAISASTIEARNDYLKKIIERINQWDSSKLERIIEELFARCGYNFIARNQCSGQGDDVDLVFEAFTGNTLLESISDIASDIVTPLIHVQAKNKSGIDDNDIDGALQLVKAEGYEKAINILINTTQKFSNEAKKYADEKSIILISGSEFASLLVKYGIDTNIPE